MSRGNREKNDCFQVTSKRDEVRFVAMDVHELSEQYRAKTDEELLQLAGEVEQLTTEARSILRSELSRRRLDSSQRIASQKQEPPTIVSRSYSQPAVAQPVGEFIPAVISLYRDNLWMFLKLTAPAVIAGTVLLLTRRQAIAWILSSGPAMARSRYAYSEAIVAGTTANLVTWLTFCLSIAAICAAVEQINAGYTGSVLESLIAVRQRLGPFVRLSLLLAFIFVAVEMIVSLITTEIFRTVDRFHGQLSSVTRDLLIYTFVGVGLLILSRLALAIPALILDDLGVVRSIFRSAELTRGKWVHLAILLIKSVVGGYVAGMLPFWLAQWLPLGAIESSTWFRWFLTAASVAAVSLVEPVMFVGFSLSTCRQPLSSRPQCKQTRQRYRNAKSPLLTSLLRNTRRGEQGMRRCPRGSEGIFHGIHPG
jgi:hypothetical protein